MRSGISARHGGHHVAQKLMSVTLPLSSSERIVRPSRSRRVNAGAATGARKNRKVMTPELSPVAVGEEASAPRFARTRAQPTAATIRSTPTTSSRRGVTEIILLAQGKCDDAAPRQGPVLSSTADDDDIFPAVDRIDG